MLNSSYRIKISNGLLMRCLTECLKNIDCQLLVYSDNTKICNQHKNTQLIPGIYTENMIHKIYKQ